MVGDVLVTKDVLRVRFEANVALEDLEVGYQVPGLGRHLVILLDYQLVLDGVEVDQLNFRETKTAEGFEHEIRDEPRNVFTANRNSLGHNPP